MKQKWMLGLAATFLAGGLAASTPCLAYEDYLNSMENRVGLYLNVGGSTYLMTDENNYIDRFNRDLSGNVGKINAGASFDMGVSYGFTDNFIIGLDYGVLTAYSRGTFSGDGNYEINLPATEAGGFLKFALPVGDQVLIGMGAGLYALRIYNGAEIISTPGLSDTYYSNGTGNSYKFFGSFEFFITQQVSLGMDLGYRLAKVYEVTDEHGRVWTKSDGSNFTLDYSGGYGKGGIRFYF